jgi:uncharacterized membrane protein (UPF0136 family)
VFFPFVFVCVTQGHVSGIIVGHLLALFDYYLTQNWLSTTAFYISVLLYMTFSNFLTYLTEKFIQMFLLCLDLDIDSLTLFVNFFCSCVILTGASLQRHLNMQKVASYVPLLHWIHSLRLYVE